MKAIKILFASLVFVGLIFSLPQILLAAGGDDAPTQETPEGNGEEEAPCDCPYSGSAGGVLGAIGCTKGCTADCKPTITCPPQSATESYTGSSTDDATDGTTFQVIKKDGKMQIVPISETNKSTDREDKNDRAKPSLKPKH